MINFIKNDNSILETDILPLMAQKREVCAFKHQNFWHAMDTLRDRNYLQNLWNSNSAPWKIWK